MRIETDIFLTEPDGIYHGKSSEYFSSHQLIDYMRCPRIYRMKRLGLIAQEDTASFRLGRATHVRLLEGAAKFNAEYVVNAPINKTTGKPYGENTKAFTEWAANQAKPVITPAQCGAIEEMAAGLDSHALARLLIKDGRAECVLRHKLEGVHCQIRIDWFNPKFGIIDLKTCRDIDRFEYDVRSYRYLNQMAFYRAVLKSYLRDDEIDIPVRLIAVENACPSRCGVWRLSTESLAAAEQENKAAIQRYIRSREEDAWPTGYEDERVI